MERQAQRVRVDNFDYTLIPKDVIEQMLMDYFTFNEIGKLQQASHFMNNLIAVRDIWRKRFKKDYPYAYIRMIDDNNEMNGAYMKYIDDNKIEKKKILDNLKISVHARYGENNTAQKVMEKGENN